VDGGGLLAAVAALAPTIRAAAGEIERERSLTPALVEALTDAGIYRLGMPRDLGGCDVDPVTVLRVVEALSKADASVGWNALLAFQNAWFAALLPELAAREVFRNPRGIIAGNVPPRNRAVACADGYRLSGRWVSVSGILHADWLFAGAPIYDGDAPRLDAAGRPVTRLFFFPRDQATLVDAWTTTGMRGTGSHDFTLDDLVVPENFAADLAAPPWHPWPLFHSFTLICPVHGAHALGTAAAAFAEVVTLAQTKVPSRQTQPLREQGWFQAQVVHADGLVQAARSLLYEATAALWETVAVGAAPTLEQRARVRLASNVAAANAVEVVDAMYQAAGAPRSTPPARSTATCGICTRRSRIRRSHPRSGRRSAV
jgi:alkylation response protein AidB-like acyl-CoA dehydrogenase